jgi:hypothetical protein
MQGAPPNRAADGKLMEKWEEKKDKQDKGGQDCGREVEKEREEKSFTEVPETASQARKEGTSKEASASFSLSGREIR